MAEDGTAAEVDLAVLLEHVGIDRRPGARAEMARSPDTRAFLEIGVELLVDDLLQHSGPAADGASTAAALFRGLSRQRIVEKGAAMRAEGRLPGTITSESQFKDRWRYADRYTEDLLAYLFRLGPYQAHFGRVWAALDAELSDLSLGQVIDALAAAEVEMVAHDPFVVLQSVVQRALPNHPKVTAYARVMYEVILPEWARLHEAICRRYGLALRPGHTWVDVAELLNVVVLGTAERIQADGSRRVLSNGRGVLAEAIRLMVPALTDLPPGTCLDELYPVMPS